MVYVCVHASRVCTCCNFIFSSLSLSPIVGYTDQQTGGYQQSAPQYHDTAGYGQPQQQPHVHQQQWGTY